MTGSAPGLSSREAAARLAEHGPNEIAPPPRFAALRELMRNLANPLVLILLVAAGLRFTASDRSDARTARS